MDIERNQSVPHNTEDKHWWLRHGERLELDFVDLCVTHLALDIRLNPAKLLDPTAPDLLVDGKIADLKTQNTPFFTASRYGLDPRFTVTFNRKDYERYISLYPDIAIFYWIDWTQTTWRDMSVDYLAGVYTLPFSKVCDLIERGAPEHSYINRRSDSRGNAKSSFLFDVRHFVQLAST